MEKGRGRDGVGEHARATDSVYLLFIFYPNLAGKEISASCPSRTTDWSRKATFLAECLVTPATLRSFFLQCHLTCGHVTLV